MKVILRFLYLYAALVVILIASIFVIILVQNASDFATPWVEDTIGTLSDLVKVVVGAAVGSLGTAVAMAVDRERKREEMS